MVNQLKIIHAGGNIFMLSETVKKYYNTKYSLNCAESVLYAANEEYKLHLDKNTLKTVAAFGGGMCVEGACGAMTGGLVVLGLIFVNGKAHESNKIKQVSKEFIEEFKIRLDTDNCKKLKRLYRKEESKCEFIIVTAAEILESIVCASLL